MNSFAMVYRSFERQFASLSDEDKDYLINLGTAGEISFVRSLFSDIENFAMYTVPIWSANIDMHLISVRTEIWK